VSNDEMDHAWRRDQEYDRDLRDAFDQLTRVLGRLDHRKDAIHIREAQAVIQAERDAIVRRWD
jgi:hypothetical protein